MVKHNMTSVPGGGGGGTFVIKEGNKPLVIAGGGGGGAAFESENGSFNGDHGQKTENGTRHGGYNGPGGNLCPVKKNNIQVSRGKGGLSQSGSNGGIGGGGAATTYSQGRRGILRWGSRSKRT